MQTHSGNTWNDPSSGELRLWRTSWGSSTRALGTFANGIYRTDDAGQTWTRVRDLGPTNSTAGAVAMASATVAVAARSANGAPFGQGGVLERSIDGGASWSVVTLPGVSSFDLLDAHFASSTLGYVGGTGLWRTTDGGATWTQLTLPAPAVPNTGLVTHVYVTPGNVLFVVTWADVWRSADHGATFTRVLDNEYLTGGLIRRISFVDANVGLGVGAGGVYRTTDAGATWTRLDLPLDAPMQSVAWAGAGTALAGGENGALLRNLALGQLASPPPGTVLRQSIRSRAALAVTAPPAKRAAAASGPRAGAVDRRELPVRSGGVLPASR